MESAHGEAAALLIEAGADRSRVCHLRPQLLFASDCLCAYVCVTLQLNLDEQTAEQLEGVGGAEQRRARAYVIDRCGPPT
jgi:26S proteasome non-ATPase regulatory subunit 10